MNWPEKGTPFQADLPIKAIIGSTLPLRELRWGLHREFTMYVLISVLFCLRTRSMKSIKSNQVSDSRHVKLLTKLMLTKNVIWNFLFTDMFSYKILMTSVIYVIADIIFIWLSAQPRISTHLGSNNRLSYRQEKLISAQPRINPTLYQPPPKKWSEDRVVFLVFDKNLQWIVKICFETSTHFVAKQNYLKLLKMGKI